MLVDEYDQYPNEKTTDVVVSSPDSDEPAPPSAADRMFLSNPQLCQFSPPPLWGPRLNMSLSLGHWCLIRMRPVVSPVIPLIILMAYLLAIIPRESYRMWLTHLCLYRFR